jgi:hypothetical protein
MDVARWLQALGCEQYAAAFLRNDVTGDILSSLTEQDLRDLGVLSVGHRRRMLDAIAALRDNASAPDLSAGSGVLSFSFSDGVNIRDVADLTLAPRITNICSAARAKRAGRGEGKPGHHNVGEQPVRPDR